MRICVFEDQGTYSLAPLTLTRPAFDLRCGPLSLLERQQRCFLNPQTGALVRPGLAELTRALHPELSVNDPAWLQADVTIMVNARWLPLTRLAPDLSTPHVGLLAGQVA